MAETSRRALLAGAAGAGVAAALGGCGGGDDGESLGSGPAATPGPTSGAPGGAAPTGSPAGAPGGAPGNGGSAGGLTTKAEIPVGGGKVFPGEGVVITQPMTGTFMAFTATCTHQDCTLSSVANGTINCGCHGSSFSAADGSVRSGPATRALPTRAIKVDGDSIWLA